MNTEKDMYKFYLYTAKTIFELLLIVGFGVSFIYNNVQWMLFFIMMLVFMKDFKE